MRRTRRSAFPVVVLAVGGVLAGCQRPVEQGEVQGEYHPRAVSAVPSSRLNATAIVPTLDTPLPAAGNGVWCASFQVAWNRARDTVIRGPLQIANSQAVADRLNDSPVTEAALPPDSFYAAAGRIEDGIIETIRKQMAEQFPGVEPPTFEDAAGFVAYAYLDSKAMFTTPFADRQRRISFRDAAGAMHAVAGFGLHEGSDWDLRKQQVAQIKVLFTDSPFDPKQFALDLTADQPEHQVIVAVLPRPQHLQAALYELAQRSKSAKPEGHAAQVRYDGILAVPNVVFNTYHEFAELQGHDKVIENPGEFNGLFIAKAWQSLQFRLDKSGAAVVSESGIYPKSEPSEFVVNGPFLVVMKRRTADQPYFVAWIENAELLETH